METWIQMCKYANFKSNLEITHLSEKTELKPHSVQNLPKVMDLIKNFQLPWDTICNVQILKKVGFIKNDILLLIKLFVMLQHGTKVQKKEKENHIGDD